MSKAIEALQKVSVSVTIPQFDHVTGTILHDDADQLVFDQKRRASRKHDRIVYAKNKIAYVGTYADGSAWIGVEKQAELLASYGDVTYLNGGEVLQVTVRDKEDNFTGDVLTINLSAVPNATVSVYAEMPDAPKAEGAADAAE